MQEKADQHDNHSGGDLYALALLLVIALAVAVRLFLMFAAHATEEDFYITLRYAQNLAQGHGFVYNPGAHVLGTTTPLYTLLLALLIRLHLDPILGGKLLGIAADVLSCYAIYRLGRSIARPGAGVAAALCLAILPTNLIWATKGMEVEVVAATTAVAWAAWAERRELVAWAAAAVLVLLRIDGAALALFLLGGTLVRDRRAPWRGLLLFALLLLPWLVFATLYFGSPVPASLQAKLIVYTRNALGRGPFPHLKEFIGLMTHRGGIVLVAGFLLAAVELLRSVSRSRAGRIHPSPPEWLLILPGLWLLSYYGSMALSPVFLFGWYFVPPTPIYYLIAMVGWSILLERLFGAKVKRIFEAAPGRLLTVTGVAGLLVGGLSAPHVLQDLRRTQAFEDDVRIPIGRWLRAHADPEDTVLLEPIGYIGYYSGLRVLDSVGLVSPEVLWAYRPQYSSPRHELWLRYRPEWVLLRGGEWVDLRDVEAKLPAGRRLVDHYSLTHTWSDPAIPGSGPSFYLFRRRD